MSAARVHALLAALPGCDLPAGLVAWLRDAFGAHAAGGDLVEALGLAGPDMDQRDDLIREVIALSPGESVKARCSFFLDCLSGQQSHPRRDMRRVIEQLQDMGTPRSVKQLRRILDYRRQDGWREGHKLPVVSLRAHASGCEHDQSTKVQANGT